MGGDRERFVFLPTSVGEIWWVVWNNMGQPPCWEPPLTDTSVMTQWRLLKTTQIPTDDVTTADAAMSDQTSAMFKKQNGIIARLKDTSRFSIWPKNAPTAKKLIYILHGAFVNGIFCTCVPNTKVYFCTSDRHGPHVMSQPLLVICEFFLLEPANVKINEWRNGRTTRALRSRLQPDNFLAMLVPHAPRIAKNDLAAPQNYPKLANVCIVHDRNSCSKNTRWKK